MLGARTRESSPDSSNEIKGRVRSGSPFDHPQHEAFTTAWSQSSAASFLRVFFSFFLKFQANANRQSGPKPHKCQMTSQRLLSKHRSRGLVLRPAGAHSTLALRCLSEVIRQTAQHSCSAISSVQTERLPGFLCCGCSDRNPTGLFLESTN